VRPHRAEVAAPRQLSTSLSFRIASENPGYHVPTPTANLETLSDTDDTTNDDAVRSRYHYRTHAGDKAGGQVCGIGKLSEESENSVGHAK
jgi:hypothetical protein